MEKHPIYTKYLASLLSKIDIVENCLIDLKDNYTVGGLEKLGKLLHDVSNMAGYCGDAANKDLSLRYEYDIVSMIKNFYGDSVDERWLMSIMEFLKKLRNHIETTEERNVAEPNEKKVSEPRVHVEYKKEIMKQLKNKIIIVDDDEDIIKLLEYEFGELGCETQSFGLGKTALEFILKEENMQDVSLLILDRVLPDMDGLDILAEYNAKSKTKVPVLILSLLATESDIIQGLQGGAVDYISKPFSVFMLMQKVLNLLKTYKQSM